MLLVMRLYIAVSELWACIVETVYIVAEISQLAQDYNDHLPLSKGFRDNVQAASIGAIINMIHKIVMPLQLNYELRFQRCPNIRLL
jgi:hypothetical protein